ncbi:hypothetical protein RKD55_000580 [Rossellomorea marisflavi]
MKRIWVACVLAAFVAIVLPFTAEAADDSTVAHWRFSKSEVKSGSLDEGKLILKDRSGKGNELVLINDGTDGLLNWSKDDIARKFIVGSLDFHNRKSLKGGQYFQTGKDAPLNGEAFLKGYTIEAVIKLPDPFTRDEYSGMGILGRKGSELTITHFKQVQWTGTPANGKKSRVFGSFALPGKKDWYHIAVVNDGKKTRVFINGAEDFRQNAATVTGLLAPNKGVWTVGKGAGKGSLFAGSIQEIRISDKALPKGKWLIPEPRKNNLRSGMSSKGHLLDNKDNYNFLFVPDPQKTVRYMPALFHDQVKWISTMQEKLNIAMTAFLGDMVDQSDSARQWEHSSLSLSVLDRQRVPYMTLAGNHDYGLGNPYLYYYGPKRYTDKPYYKGTSPSKFSSYSMIEAGSYEYLFLSVDMGHLKKDLPWAKKVLKEHPGVPTILLSHEILTSDGTFPVDTNRGSRLWEGLVDGNDQIFMTVNGHHQGTVHRIKENRFGHSVIQVLVDYQSSYNGGNGWMRLAEFDEKHNKIRFRTYSPWADSLSEKERSYFDAPYLTGDEHQFTVPFQFKERFDF